MKNQFPAALAAIAFASSAQPGWAQGASEPENGSAAAYGIALDPITIFATLNPTSTFDYPGQVSVIDREELQTRQASTIADVLQDTPGVVVDGGGRRAGQAPTIRGFREEDILVLVDGVRQSFLSVHDGRLFIDPDLLKSAEVVKGPISSLYGSGALGGVIALTTVDAADFLDPGETQGVRLKAGYRSAEDEVVLTSTGFARSEDGRFDVVASFTYRNAGDIELGDGAATPGGTPLTILPNEDDIRSGLLKSTVELSPDLKLTGTWITFRNDGINPNNPQGDDDGDVLGGTNTNRLVDRLQESDQLSGKLSWNPAGNPLIDGNLLVYWTSQLNQEDENIDPIFPRDRVLERRIDTIGTKIDNRSRLTLSDTTKLTLTYGAEYYVDEQTGEDTQILGSDTDPNTLNPVADAEAAFGGIFLQGNFDIQAPLGLPGELTLLPSVRWDTYDLTYKDDDPALSDFSDEAISKKLGISYKPTPWLLLFANYGEAFRAPSFIELFAQGNHFPGGRVYPPFGPATLAYNRFIPNPNLKPQDGTTIEGGLGFDFKDVAVNDDRLKIKGSYWKTDAENFIDTVVEDSGCSFAPFPPFDQEFCFTRFENRDAELDGVEISLTYDSARFLGGITYETIDGTDKDTGEFLGSLYPDRYIVHAGVKLPEIWSTIGARVTFADEFTKVNDPSLAIDGYTTLDLYTSFQPLEGDLKGLRVDLGVDNVTDEAYAQGAAPTNFQPGIDYKAAVSWTYKW